MGSKGQIEVELQGFMGDDRTIAEVAWTSSFSRRTKEQKTDEDVARLVRMLILEKHSTPIESVVMRFWIKMPIFTDRQHMTHRIASHNGLSGRYRTMPEEFFQLPTDVRGILQVNGLSDFSRAYEISCEEANTTYRQLLVALKKCEEHGTITNGQYKRVREIFRGMLPTAGMTERVTTMNLRSFANYQKLRNSDHAQPEIREVARQMLEQVEQVGMVPVALSALKEVDWNI